MPTETEVSQAMWWRGKVVELREVAGRTADPVLRRRLFDVADRWEKNLRNRWVAMGRPWLLDRRSNIKPTRQDMARS